MSPGTKTALPVQVRPALAKDLAFVTRVSGQVFNVFGAYDEFLPKYLDHPDVITTVAQLGRDRVGFTMLALVVSETPLPWRAAEAEAAGPDPSGVWVDAEMVAIAVAPRWQDKGIGRHLLGTLIDYVRERVQDRNIRSLQLNVADDNLRARGLFDSTGFRVVDEEDGRYPKGQRSIRMALEL